MAAQTWNVVPVSETLMLMTPLGCSIFSFLRRSGGATFSDKKYILFRIRPAKTNQIPKAHKSDKMSCFSVKYVS